MTKELEHIVADKWSYVVNKQRFALRTPRVSARALDEAFACGAFGLRKVSTILLAAASGVSLRIDKSVIEKLLVLSQA